MARDYVHDLHMGPPQSPDYYARMTELLKAFKIKVAAFHEDMELVAEDLVEWEDANG